MSTVSSILCSHTTLFRTPSGAQIGRRVHNFIGNILARFKNFKIWRGRLPHWRADDVRYFVTFRHRRELDEGERRVLFLSLLKPDGSRFDLIALLVLSDRTEMLFTVRKTASGEAYELSKTIEQAKSKAGKAICKSSGERFPPFYTESYDHIVRDEDELDEFAQKILDGPFELGWTEDLTNFPTLWWPQGS